MGGKNTISSSDTKIEALKLQSSSYGVTVPVVGGVNRVPGNLLYYSDFLATAHTTSSTSGKGGGVKTVNTAYTYSANVIMGLCQGQIQDILRIWVGKNRYDAAYAAPDSYAATETVAVTALPQTYVTTNSAKFAGIVSVGVPPTGSFFGGREDGGDGQSGAINGAEGVDFIVSGGSIIFPVGSVFLGLTATITYKWQNPPVLQSAMTQLGLTLTTGLLSQAAPSWVTSLHPADAVTYPLQAYINAQNYSLGQGAQVQNHNFEVVGYGAYAISTSIPDCDPSAFCRSVLMDARYGARMPASTVQIFANWTNYCLSNSIWLSPALLTQMTAADFITQMGALTNTAPIWAVNRLKMIPYGDKTTSANGYTYTPNTAPYFDLTTDHFIVQSGESPVRVTRTPKSDRYNNVKIEFLNRANYYNKEIVEVKDDADISVYGLRTMSNVDGSWIADANVARVIAQLLMQRSLNVQATYEFTLPWSFCLLEPMDLVTITDADQGFTKKAVRITKVEEDETGKLSVSAEDYPAGSASHTVYPYQQAGGYQINYNATPPSVAVPLMFEAPVVKTATGLMVYAAVAGNGANWGGCTAWVSFDGTNYQSIGTVNLGARYGTITDGAGISSGSTAVNVLLSGNGGQIAAATAALAAQNQSLIWVDGTNGGEFMNYVTATLTGTNAYTLGSLGRGAYQNPAASHALGAKFCRLDASVMNSGPLDLSMIGQTIYFKFTSFNQFGAVEQSLASVTAYPYLITGAQAKLPPSDVTGFSNTTGANGITVLSWADIADPDRTDFEIRVGSTWAGGTLVTRTANLNYSIPQLSSAGSPYTYWIAARDFFLNYSNNPVSTVATISAPSVPGAPSVGLAYSTEGVNEVISWGIPATGSTVERYEIRYGTTGVAWASATFLDTTKATAYRRKADYTVARDYLIGAYDVAGNLSPLLRIASNITAPGAPGGGRAEVIDNNVLLYWSAPSTGSLPIDRYEVRKGATWGTATVIGSNSNSTFTSVFEQASGVYTYWIGAYDSAGNLSSQISIVATVNQPPDYVLKTNVDSALCGNMDYHSATDKNALITVNRTSGLVTHTTTDTTWAAQRADVGFSAGRWYWEVTATSVSSATVGQATIGIGKSTASLANGSYAGFDANGWGYLGNTGNKFNSATGTAYGASWGTGDTIGVLLDMEALTLTFYKNGVSQGAIAITAGTWIPMNALYYNADSLTANFGATAFKYPVPANCNGSFDFLLDFPSKKGFVPMDGTESWTGHYNKNLLLYSEQIDNASGWAGASWTVTANSVAAPDGATTAELFTEVAASAQHYRQQNSITIAAGSQITYAISAKAGTSSKVQLFVDDFGSANGFHATFDLSAGTVTQSANIGTGSGVVARIFPDAGTGWWRISVTGKIAPAATSLRVAMCAVNSGTPGFVPSFFGVVTNTLYMWGASLKLGDTSNDSYVSTTSAAVAWATPQAQITAGYPIYINPSHTSTTYVEYIDNGATIATASIGVTVNSTLLSGAVTTAVQIYSKLNLGDAWTALAAGASALATNFRYVKVVVSFSATPGANLLQVNAINFKISVKSRRDSGTGTAAVAGTTVNFAYPFISCDTPIVQPAGSGAARFAVVTYAGGANPTGFSVQILNSAGTDVGGNFSWTASGY